MSAALQIETLARAFTPGCSFLHSPGLYLDFVVYRLPSLLSFSFLFFSLLPQLFSLNYPQPLDDSPSPMISSPGLRVPEPLTQLIPTDWREVSGPLPSTVRFELDISLLVYQPLNYITVTLTTAQIETKECTVDNLKDVIFSRLGQQRTAFWMALPSTGDSRVWEVPHTPAPWKIWFFIM